MAKASYSPLGNWSGRAGGQVYRVRSGEQIITAYQPNVNNPRTDAQLKQRAKLALAGKLSSILLDNMIYGLASSRTARRATLLSIITNKATAVLDPSALDGERSWLGRIFPSQIELSKGFDYINADTGTLTATKSESVEEVAIDADNLDFLKAEGNEANKLMIVDIYGETVAFGNAYVGAQMYEMDANHSNIEITGAGVHRFYAIPINNSGNRALGRPNYDNLSQAEVSSQNPLQVAGTSNLRGASANYGKSVFLGEFTLTA